MGPIRGASLCLHTVWGRAPSSGHHGAACCHTFPADAAFFGGTLPQKPALSGGLPPMSADDDNRFRPKPGRIRSDASKAGQAKSFLTKVRKIARQHGAGLRSNLAKRQRRRWRQARAERCGHFRPGRQARARRGLRPIPQSVERLESSPSWQPPRHRQVAFRPCGWQERQGRRPSALHPARRHLARWRARPALFGDRRPRRWRCFPRSRQGTIATSSASSSRLKTPPTSKT